MIAGAFAARRRAARAESRDRRVRLLVAHAYERVPYYRRLFDTHGVRPERIRGVSDLSQIPTTTRRDLAALPVTDLIAAGVDAERLLEIGTTGASGVPFAFRRTWLEHRRLHLIRARMLYDAGVRPADRVAKVCAIGPGASASSPSTHLISRLLHASAMVRRIDTFLPAHEIADQIVRHRPDVVTGAPGVLAVVAGVFGSRQRPRLVLSESETLTDDLRTRITTGFGAPVRDVYSSSEFGVMAAECRSDAALHACDAGLVLEVMREDDRAVGPGEMGEVVGTSLNAFAMPLIRYRQGDLVTQGEARCSCGGPGRTIRGVVGRTVDLFPLPDGRLLHPYELVAVLRDDLGNWVAQYQLVQQARDHVVLRLVPASAPPAERLEAIQAAAAAVLGPRVQFDAVVIPAIRRELSGTLRVFRSHVAGKEPDQAVA